MPNSTQHESAKLLAAFGDDTRLRLIGSFCQHGPASITRLSPDFDVTRQAIPNTSA